jgi:hypothetical protein
MQNVVNNNFNESYKIVWLHVQKNDLRELQCPFKYSKYNKIILKVILWELLLQDIKWKWFCAESNGKPWILRVLIFVVKDNRIYCEIRKMMKGK